MVTPSASDRTQSGSHHRRQVIWQIIFPVVLAAVGGVVLVVMVSLAAINGSTASSQWASIATIWLVLPLLVIGLLFALVTAGMIFLLARLTQKLPTFTHLVHTYLQIINIRLGILLNRVAQPQISTLSRWAALKAFWSSLLHTGRRR